MHLAIVGGLLQAGYLGGVWAAVMHGILQGPCGVDRWPATLADRRAHVRCGAGIHNRQWVGLLLGFGGLALVVLHKLEGGELTAHNLLLALLALGSITAGTLWQKRFVQPASVWVSITPQMPRLGATRRAGGWAVHSHVAVRLWCNTPRRG